MNRPIENIEKVSELTKAVSDEGKTILKQDTMLENLKLAKEEGNAEAVSYYEKQLSKFSVDKKLNEESDISIGSSCEEFCQDTRTNRTKGNYTREGH